MAYRFRHLMKLSRTALSTGHPRALSSSLTKTHLISAPFPQAAVPFLWRPGMRSIFNFPQLSSPSLPPALIDSTPKGKMKHCMSIILDFIRMCVDGIVEFAKAVISKVCEKSFDYFTTWLARFLTAALGIVIGGCMCGSVSDRVATFLLNPFMRYKWAQILKDWLIPSLEDNQIEKTQELAKIGVSALLVIASGAAKDDLELKEKVDELFKKLYNFDDAADEQVGTDAAAAKGVQAGTDAGPGPEPEPDAAANGVQAGPKAVPMLQPKV